jgi:uncharacterized protein (DUF433 family)
MNEDAPVGRVATDAAVCHGMPHIRGTRVLVSVVIDALAAGMTAKEITEHYPTLTTDDVEAATAFHGRE